MMIDIFLITMIDNVTPLGFILFFEPFLQKYHPFGINKNEKKKELEQLANSLNENDNPVLMLVKLKE